MLKTKVNKGNVKQWIIQIPYRKIPIKLFDFIYLTPRKLVNI